MQTADAFDDTTSLMAVRQRTDAVATLTREIGSRIHALRMLVFTDDHDDHEIVEEADAIISLARKIKEELGGE